MQQCADDVELRILPTRRVEFERIDGAGADIAFWLAHARVVRCIV